jgi:hypothetical protein
MSLSEQPSGEVCSPFVLDGDLVVAGVGFARLLNKTKTKQFKKNIVNILKDIQF